MVEVRRPGGRDDLGDLAAVLPELGNCAEAGYEARFPILSGDDGAHDIVSRCFAPVPVALVPAAAVELDPMPEPTVARYPPIR